jgi:23S rRNA pseudouridine2605 synthase
MGAERIQKLIARAGLCSRRDAENLISEGRVTVNGRIASLGDQADPSRDHVKIDGKLLRHPEPLRYVLLYKPRGVMTTCDDPGERTTVVDLVRPRFRERLFPIGRLDYHSEGLILLTNDGELTEKVSHPRHGVVREYHVKIRGDLDAAQLKKLLAGTMVDGRRVRPRTVRRVSATPGGVSTWWRIEVTEGRTHEVRELFFRAGHHVQRLRRTGIGPVRDQRLRPGDLRELTDDEVRALKGERPARQQRRRQPSRGVRGKDTAPKRSRASTRKKS